ncbi:hypothetical protein GEMRC1_003107 [Eukaryota sp. GEM-RC1]
MLLYSFEEEVHHTISTFNLLSPGDHVALCVSGGKDSACLAEVVCILNRRYNYGAHLHLLCIDEGIKGYRDLSLKCVNQLQQRLDLPLTILSFNHIFGFTLDQAIQVSGHSKSCTICGSLRRRSLTKGAKQIGSTKLCLGHNADDSAETVLLNLIRGDTQKLLSCSSSRTGGEDSSLITDVTRVRPFMRSFQKEIVLYCHFKKLPYFSTECLYAHSALRGVARSALLAVSQNNSSAVLNLIDSAAQLKPLTEVQAENKRKIYRCSECDEVSVYHVCQTCCQVNKIKEKLELVEKVQS